MENLHGHFLQYGLVAEALTDIRDIRLRHRVTRNAGLAEVVAKPMLLDSRLVAALLDGVAGKLAHVHGVELVDLRGYGVLLYQRLFGEGELEGVIGRERYVEAALEVRKEGIAFVREEQSIVAEWGHGNTDLLEIEDVLQERHFAE